MKNGPVDGPDLYLWEASGAGNEETILKTPHAKYPEDWSRDGKFLAYTTAIQEDNWDIWIMPMSSSGDKTSRQPFPFLQSKFGEVDAAFSPDGKWMAYESDESGQSQIYIRPFPGPGGKWQVSTKGGVDPHWRGDGKELFFVDSESFHMMSADISTRGATVSVGVERKLFQFGSGNIRDYDVTSDGQRFLMAAPRDIEKSIPVTLAVNWLEELKGNK